MSTTSSTRQSRVWAAILSILFAFALLLMGVQALSAQTGTPGDPALQPEPTPTVDSVPVIVPQEGDTTPGETQLPDDAAPSDEPTPEVAQVADLSQSSKSADTSSAAPGDSVGYTIVVSNTGINTASNVMVTDTLPVEVDYISGTLNVATTGLVSGTTYTVVNDVVTFQAQHIGASAAATLTFDVVILNSVADGAIITNTALISGAGSVLAPDAVITVIDTPSLDSGMIFMPVIYIPLTPPVLNPVSRPTPNNQWTVTWQPVSGVLNYTVQQAQTTDFTNVVETTVSGTTHQVTQPLTWNNEYFYRVRANTASQSSGWSNTQSVVGGYLDNFDDTNSGWLTRYSTYIEKVRAFYESGNLIIQSEDSWDWGLASPLRKAPEVPYVIEFRNQPAALGNLVSMGMVFSGNWEGAPCPEVSSVEGWYQQQNCFTQFYNVNIINKNLFAPDSFKMLFERVSGRIWCPECGGSPMKRIYPTGIEVEPIPFVSADGWNTYRVEVRDSGISLYINNQLFFTQTELDSWLDQPYFGLFVSTDEYSNSTWRVDYVKITTLDN